MWISGLLLSSALLMQGGQPRPARPRGDGTPRPAAPATPTEAEGNLQPEPAMDRDDDVSSPVAEPEASGRPLVDVKPIKPHVGAAELLREALTVPKSGGGLAGQGVGLASVLSRVNRTQHLEAARLYWKLSKVLSEHHYALDEYQRLATLVIPNEPPEPDARRARPLDQQPLADRLQIEQATSRARLREAELDAMYIQSELAGLLQRTENEPLPLPGDAPHVGQYRTAYEQIFGARNVSPRLRFIARALPIQRQIIETRAQAILSAEDSALTATESFNRGEAKLTAVVARYAELARQRRAFVMAIAAYNDNIAEYALAAAGDKVGVQELVGMMLKSPLLPAGGAAPREARPSVRPPVDDSDADRQPAIDADDPSAERSTRSALRRVVARPPTGRRLVDPWEGVTADPTGGNASGHFDSPLYSALASLSPVKRTHQLAVSLHLDYHMPADSGVPVSLEELLRTAPAEQRRPIVAAFWRARERVARHHVLTEQFNHLQSYTPLLLEKRKTDSGARAMVDLRTAKLAAEAALLEGRLDLHESQLELTRLAGRKLDAPWLLPTTRPHAGRYLVRDNASQSAAPKSRLASFSVGGRFDALIDRATAVVQADSACAQAATGYKLNEQLIDELLLAVAVQTQESFDFLSALTRYNLAILEYVETEIGAPANADQFLKAIIVQR